MTADYRSTPSKRRVPIAADGQPADGSEGLKPPIEGAWRSGSAGDIPLTANSRRKRRPPPSRWSLVILSMVWGHSRSLNPALQPTEPNCGGGSGGGVGYVRFRHQRQAPGAHSIPKSSPSSVTDEDTLTNH